MVTVVDPGGAAQLQLTWARGGLLAWQPAHSRVGANIQGSLARNFNGGLPWSQTTIAHLTVPSGSLQVIGQHLTPEAFVTVGEVADDSSPSMRWFAGLRSAAIQMVRCGRVIPHLQQQSTHRWRATWRPVDTDRMAAAASFARWMPAVCLADAQEPQLTAEVLAATVLDTFVDVASRATLRGCGWRPAITDTRRRSSSAVRAVARALVGEPEFAVTGHEPLGPEMAEIATAFTRMVARAGGIPVIRTRLRLALPDEDDGDWPIALELVDADDRSRWCTVGDVVEGSPAAQQLAGGADKLAALAAAVDAAANRLAVVLPFVVAALGEPDSTIELDQAATVLDSFDELREADIELLVPEQLTKRSPQVRANASPQGDSSGRFGAEALVSWQLVVDDEPVDEATLQRAAELGTSLIEVGGRWVRLEGGAVRRRTMGVAFSTKTIAVPWRARRMNASTQLSASCSSIQSKLS
ncbi:MAG: SNF2 helicase-associated domain-containing protein, partial [Ilumatobacteraceae bacterium]